jgi:hypothetical protein
MVEVAEVTEVAQHRRAVPGLPAVARGEAMAGAVSWVTADLIWTDQPILRRVHNKDKSPTMPCSHTCRAKPYGATSMKGLPPRIAIIVTLQMQQTACPTSHDVATLRDPR